jgi:two-component system nitrogen regulation response regulator GlnG/two-component system response regulator AtoC
MTPSEVLDEGDFDLPELRGTPVPNAEPENLDLHAAVESLERTYVLLALKRAQGNRAEAARLLGIARPQLYAKMKDLGIDPEAVRD